MLLWTTSLGIYSLIPDMCSNCHTCISFYFGYCCSLQLCSTHDVTSHLQRILNFAARVIFCLPMSSTITKNSKSLHWRPVNVRSTYIIACLYYHCHSNTAPSCVIDMLKNNPSCIRNTRSRSHTMPLLNAPARSKATLLLLLLWSLVFFRLLSKALFKMMSGVPHHCHHLCLVWRNTCFFQFTKTKFPSS